MHVDRAYANGHLTDSELVEQLHLDALVRRATS